MIDLRDRIHYNNETTKHVVNYFTGIVTYLSVGVICDEEEGSRPKLVSMNVVKKYLSVQVSFISDVTTPVLSKSSLE